ncbi:RES family NAD+ phosphorylase [Kushneria marisflavi]|uniref:Uncharacterized protein n=1 Tax=Kushneria marisflavi TaxID=157779 RepID=A0A240UNX4_9GAMM|nr:RES family NAD+ phosphorylase [Kushneria marisflavi]ART62742.1 hypothetical protein B9H00_06500 [Kushneria marisflavi]RKD83850.1 RES domain-containing protein [Kushneria marisflavi]
MVSVEGLPVLPAGEVEGYRLIPSKFPPIALFDDVASIDEFEVLHELQALTNPRLQAEIGNLALIDTDEIPFGIRGCSYATAPFTHVNLTGSRFSRGRFGVLYIADEMATAIAEVSHHQTAYWRKVPELGYERFVLRGLHCRFDQSGMADALMLASTHAIYAPDDYTASRALGDEIHAHGLPGLRYRSARSPGNLCWGLMTPRPVRDIVQTEHYEMVWNGAITHINRISAV